MENLTSIIRKCQNINYTLSLKTKMYHQIKMKYTGIEANRNKCKPIEYLGGELFRNQQPRSS